MLSLQLPRIFCYIRQKLWIYQAKPSVAMSSKTAWTRNGDSDVPMFPSRIRTSFARSAWYEAEDCPETSAYCLTIRRINTEMYKILIAVLLRFKSFGRPCLTPRIKVLRSFGISGATWQSTRRNVPENLNIFVWLSLLFTRFTSKFLSVSVGCIQSICIQLGWRNTTRCDSMHIFIYC